MSSKDTLDDLRCMIGNEHAMKRRRIKYKLVLKNNIMHMYYDYSRCLVCEPQIYTTISTPYGGDDRYNTHFDIFASSYFVRHSHRRYNSTIGCKNSAPWDHVIMIVKYDFLQKLKECLNCVRCGMKAELPSKIIRRLNNIYIHHFKGEFPDMVFKETMV